MNASGSDLNQEDFEIYHKISSLMKEDKSKERKIVMFHVCSVGQIQYLLPIYNELKRRNLNYAYYFASDYSIQEKLNEIKFPMSHFVTTDIAEKLELTDIFLEAEIYGRGPQQAKRVFVGHGQPTKFTYWPDGRLKSFNYYFLNGELEKSMFEVIKQSNPEATKHIKLINTGYPKVDDLINGVYKKKEVLHDLGLEADRKTILYAPAWDPGGTLRTHGSKIVEKLLSLDKINIIVKLHPVSLEPVSSPYYNFYTGGVDWKKKFEVFNAFPNFRFVNDYFINPLLSCSDIMVTDFSGVALEFMVLDRPVIYIDCPEFYGKTQIEWGNDPNMAKNDDRFNAGRNAGIVIHNLEELPKAIKRAFDDPGELSSERKSLIQDFLYNPGKGAQSTADAIIELLDYS